MTWREYHDATKHSVESLQRAPHFLDWANMPDPFRHYQGTPVLDLPADPPFAVDGPTFLSRLLYHSAAVSASKQVPSGEYRYALRVNPSSGNLHPTEFHFIARGLEKWPDGLYHYRASSHMAEQRAAGNFESELTGCAPITFVLTTIAWREAWKYRARAYRYCLLDIGHAWQSLALAAGALGCDSTPIFHFPDDEVSKMLRLPGDEWPMLIIRLHGGSIPAREPDGGGLTWFNGQPNRLSDEEISYPLIQNIHAATKLDDWQIPGSTRAAPFPSLWKIARTRRSALDFVGGTRSMSFAQLSAILAAAAPGPCIQLYLYVHRVEDLEPGVYRRRLDQLELLKAGDQRVVAAGLSLGQDLAGNACVAFSMIADFGKGYRYTHFEAGATGHRMYLAAEALGLQATGIGAFFDEEVHRYLNLTPDQGEVVYHFAIGYAVADPRLDAASSTLN